MSVSHSESNEVSETTAGKEAIVYDNRMDCNLHEGSFLQRPYISGQLTIYFEITKYMAQSIFVSVALTLRPCHVALAQQTYVHRQDVKAM